MAQKESIVVLDIQAEGAVKSIGDLKNNIKALKGELDTLEVGTEDYQNTLEELKTNQNALKDAMYATSSSMEDVRKAALGQSESYNSLVHRMAALKEEWRAVDTSTEQGKQRFKELSVQINDVNDKLKAMDAGVGNYQRNVGNYESALKNFHNVVKDLPKPLNAVKDKLDVVDKSMSIMSVNPIIGIISLLSPILKDIAEDLKENETAIGGIKKLMDALQPIMDFMKGAIQKVAELFSKAVDYVIELGSNSTTSFKDIIGGATGVGNAILQYLLTPIRIVITAVKGLGQTFMNVFKGDFKEAAQTAKDALSGIGDAFQKGFDFKNNFDIGKQVGIDFASGIKSTKSKTEVEGAAKEMGEAFALKFKETAEPSLHDIFNNVDKMLKEQSWDPWEEMASNWPDEFAEINAEIDEFFAEQNRIQAEANRKAEELSRQRIETMFAVAGATADVLGSIADMYEADEAYAEQNAERIKSLRIAEATINTISGAIGAFMGITKDTNGWGIALAAIQAATITATGMAQIGKIKKTNVKGGASTSALSSAPISVTAPSTTADIPTIRTATSASEEERLNQMASSQRVYILQSDIEAAQNQSKTQIAETTFA